MERVGVGALWGCGCGCWKVFREWKVGWWCFVAGSTSRASCGGLILISSLSELAISWHVFLELFS